MPLFMDIHDLHGDVSPEEVAKAHAKDIEIQKKYGVEYRKYWVNEDCGKIFCLVEAPDAESAIRVHSEAHGMVADKIIEIQPPELAEVILGGVETSAAGAVLVPGTAGERDPGIRTILFTDIVDSTALTQQLGDQAAMAFLDLHNEIVRNALSCLSGREVKHTGDGIMASFLSAAGAIRCATQIQRDVAAHKGNRDGSLKVRIGAAAGEPVEAHDDLFGCTVQLAARLCGHALPEQILVSNAIAELCLGKGFSFQDLGEVGLKGFAQPIRAHAVAWESAATA
jgi:class 3 adenylate cyclase